MNKISLNTNQGRLWKTSRIISQILLWHDILSFPFAIFKDFNGIPLIRSAWFLKGFVFIAVILTVEKYSGSHFLQHVGWLRRTTESVFGGDWGTHKDWFVKVPIYGEIGALVMFIRDKNWQSRNFDFENEMLDFAMLSYGKMIMR